MAFWRPGERLPGLGGSDRDHNGADGSASGAGTGDAQERDTAASSLDREVASVQFNPNYRFPLHQQRQRLPVYAHRREILYAVESHATTVLVGATGSGKTTQVPQYLMEAGWAQRHRRGEPRIIVCTQPRRIAAITIAERVAKEVGTPLGKQVGYAVRFDEQWDPEETKIKFCTDGLLLRETMLDPLLSRYSVIMLDEAHERNLETDILLGLIKKIQRKRPALRVIIASATLHVDTFTRFFRSKSTASDHKTTIKDPTTLRDVVAVSVEGRQYPVDIQYLQEPCSDYLTTTIETVLAIDHHEARGDILVFLPGQEEIDHVVRVLREQSSSTGSLHVLPLYASLPVRMQQAAFLPPPSPHTQRKVIVATNIAETSVTIEGIVFVVDSCFAKLAFFNPFTGVESLLTTQVSRAAAQQRAGRAGRSQAGKCLRLCTQAYYDTQLPAHTLPQMQRTKLTRVVLHLLAMGIQDVAHFEFVSPPTPEAVIRALEELYALGAIEMATSPSSPSSAPSSSSMACQLVEPVGIQLAEFPVDPMLARALLAAAQVRDQRVLPAVLSIAAMLSVGDIFVSARGSKQRRVQIAEAMAEFADRDGDHLTLLAIHDAFVGQLGRGYQRGRENPKKRWVPREWCNEHMLNPAALTRAREIRRHLKRYVVRFQSSSTEGRGEEEDLNKEEEEEEGGPPRRAILRCFVRGFFAQAARLHPDGRFRTVRDQRILEIHPTSVFYHLGSALPDWILFHESVVTTQEYVRDVSRVDPRWLVMLAPDFYRTRDVSASVSGSSGALGLPASSSGSSSKNKSKNKSTATAQVEDKAATDPAGRLLFRKPTGAAKRARLGTTGLPVHTGKSKGGLRSQF